MKILIKRNIDGKLTFQQTSRIGIITIKRPGARNAMSSAMWNQLIELCEEVRKSAKIKVLVLRGSDGQFTSGSDIKEFSQMSLPEAEEAFEAMERAISALESLPIPVIGSIDGPAMGAGFVLSLACDIRIGSPNTKMGIPVGRLGITVGPPFTRRIVRLIGPSRTKELVYTGKIYDAQEAYQLGLINRLVPHEELNDKVLEIAFTIMRQSAASLKAVKQAVDLSEWRYNQPWSFVDPVDFPEGCRAFVEKRRPHFQ